MVKVGEVEQVGCAVMQCNVAEALDKEQKAKRDLERRYKGKIDYIQKMKELYEKSKIDPKHKKECIEYLAKEDMRKETELENANLIIDEQDTKITMLNTQIEEIRKDKADIQKKFYELRTMRDLSNEYKELEQKVEKIKKDYVIEELNLRKIKDEILKKTKEAERIADIKRKDVIDINTIREEQNKWIDERKQYIKEVGLYKKERDMLRGQLVRLNKLVFREKKKILKKQLWQKKTGGQKLKGVFVKEFVADPKLIKYIQESLKRGQHIDKIKGKLVEHGWPIDKVENAIDEMPHRF